jgi:sulfur-carrier protein
VNRVRVEVRVFADLRKYVPGSEDPLFVGLPEGSTLQELLALLGIPTEKVKVLFVNSRQQHPAFRLTDGDRVGIFPPTGGG